MQRYDLKMHGFSPSSMDEAEAGYWVEFSVAADRIEKLEKALKKLTNAVGSTALCYDWCEAKNHEDDPTPNPYCDCGMCDLIDRADEAQLLLNELCTCGGKTLHENGCASLEP